MAKIDLSKYGITGTTEVVYNPSYELLFEEETKPELEGFEKGQESELGAVNVMTGVYTGRSPKDKFIVMDENSKDTVWWTSDEYKNDNHPATEEAWAAVKDIAIKELSNKRLFVVDVHSARLSFAKPEYMEKYLDITPGSVSVLGLMNDSEKKVQLLIDEDVMKEPYFGCHPCINTSSLKFTTEDLMQKIIPALEHEPVTVTLPVPE